MFKINIEDRTVNTLFDTGATRSVMSADTFKILKLKDKDLTIKNIPRVVGVNGTSLGAIGQVTCEIKIGKKECKQTFLVCQNLKRNLILGVDFAQKHAAGVHWTKHNSFVLKNPLMDLADRTQDSVTPFVIVNLSTDQRKSCRN